MGDDIVNFYAGQPPLNRLSFQRPSTKSLTAHLSAGEAKFLLWKDGKPLMKKGEAGQPLYLSQKEASSFLGGAFVTESATDLVNKDRAKLLQSARIPHTLPIIVFLGIDDRPSASDFSVPASQDPLTPKGVPYWAVDVGKSNDEIDGGEFVDTRAAGSAMSGWDAGIFAQARAMVDWNTRNKFCPACGSPTYSLWGGWKRNCTTALEPIEGKEPCFSTKGLHNFAYPRTDPVIIMGILDATGEKMLLGRQKSWPKGMYSCLAGFIEPGESFEDAVRREVMEEAGIEVGPVRYSSSQPWPYPSNIMVGCFGRAKDGQTIRLDLDNELEDAQWFSKDLIRSMLATEKPMSKEDLKKLDNQQSAALAPAEKKEGEVVETGVGITRVPPRTAIAGQLVHYWARGDLDLVSKL
ncbi:NAD+ diphosphatase, partial [Tremellales sp. Uapishka_1]